MSEQTTEDNEQLYTFESVLPYWHNRIINAFGSKDKGAGQLEDLNNIKICIMGETRKCFEDLDENINNCNICGWLAHSGLKLFTTYNDRKTKDKIQVTNYNGYIEYRKVWNDHIGAYIRQ